MASQHLVDGPRRLGHARGIDATTHTRFLKAFGWFDDYRWAWAYDPDGEGAPAYRIRPAPPGACGTIQIFMPTATHELTA